MTESENQFFQEENEKHWNLIKRGVIFIFSSFLILGSFFVLISTKTLNYGSNENFISIFSTAAQSQAAIIAIVISLSLIIVQLTAEKYSSRITPLFFKRNVFWGLLGAYGISVIYDMLMLWTSSNNQLGIYFGIILMILSLAALFFYIEYTIDLLKPSTVIEIVSNETEPEDIDCFLKNQEIIENPLIAIFDIITSAMNDNNQISINNGVKAVINIFKKTLDFMEEKYHIPLKTKFLDFDKELHENLLRFDEMVLFFGNEMTSITLDFIDKKLYLSAIYSINSLNEMFVLISCKESQNKDSAGNLIVNIGNIDSEIEKFLEKEGYQGKIADQKKLKLVTLPIKTIEKMTINAIDERFDTVTIDYGINLLGKIGLESLKINKREFETFSDIYEPNHDFKGPLRLHAVVMGLSNISEKIIENLPKLTDEKIEEWEDGVKYDNCKFLLNSFDEAMRLLNHYCFFAIENKYNYMVEKTAKSYETIFFMLIDKNYPQVYEEPHPITTTLNSMKCLFDHPENELLLDLINDMDLNLQFNAKQSIEKNNFKSFRVIINTIYQIYIFDYNINKHSPIRVLKKAPRNLGEMGLLCIRKESYDSFDEVKNNYNNLIKLSPSWEYFNKTIISYMSLWCLELIKKNELSMTEDLIINLKELNQILNDKGCKNIVYEIISNIDSNRSFKYVYIEKMEYDPIFRLKNEKCVPLSILNGYLGYFQIFKDKMILKIDTD